MVARLALASLAVLACFGMSGFIFGYAPLKHRILTERCASADDCDDSDMQLHLDLMFAMASSATNIAAVFLGILMDLSGPKITSSSGSICFAIGSIAMGHALSNELSTTGVLPIVAFILMAVGGSAVFMASLHIANLFPRKSGTLIALLTCSFDASSLVLYAFSLVAAPLSSIFYAYAIIPILIAILFLELMPHHAFQPNAPFGPLPEDEDETEYLIDDDRSIEEMSLFAQISSPDIWLVMLFMSAMMLRINFYIATVAELLETQLNGNVELLMHMFGVLLPTGGVLAFVPIAYMLDNLSSSSVFFILCAMNLASSAAIFSHWLSMQLLAMIVIVIMRPMVYAAISDLSLQTFGVVNFGKLYGGVTFISGLVNISQYSLRMFEIRIANLILLIFTFLATLVLPLYLLKKHRNRVQELN